MMNRRITVLLALALVTVAGRAGAGSEMEPQVLDAAGDANFLNANGGTNLTDPNGPDTRPASIDGADIRSITFSTPYTTTKVLNEDGTVGQVVYGPSALQVQISTQGAVKPTFGPSLMFRVVTNIEGCDAWFEATIRGSSPSAIEVEQASLRVFGGTGCPAATTMTNGYSLNVTGNIITMTYPMSANTGGLVAIGKVIGPDGSFTNAANAPHVRTFLGVVTAPTIDETAQPQPFTVGSDVPAAVICADQPAHPDCQA